MDGGKWDTTEKSRCSRRLGGRSPGRAALPHQVKQVRRRPQNSTYTWSLKSKQVNKINQMHRHREQISGFQRGRGGGWGRAKWEKGVKCTGWKVTRPAVVITLLLVQMSNYNAALFRTKTKPPSTYQQSQVPTDVRLDGSSG